MRKLVLTFAAIGLFFTGVQAQEGETTTSTQGTTQTVAQDDDFQKIEVAEIPAPVTTAITRDYAGATTQEVWVKEKDGKVVYKLKLNVDGEERDLYADAQGNWIDKKDKNKNS